MNAAGNKQHKVISKNFHDFWNQTSPSDGKMLVEALKNLSIIGALFIIAGYGRSSQTPEPVYSDV